MATMAASPRMPPTCEYLLLTLHRLDLAHVAGRIVQSEFAAAIVALILAQTAGMELKRGRLLRYQNLLLLILLYHLIKAVLQLTALTLRVR